MDKSKKKILTHTIVVIFSLAISPAYAQQNQAEKQENKKEAEASATTTAPISPMTDLKSITGEVGVVRKEYISVIYRKEKDPDGSIIRDYEMVIPINESVILNRIKSIDDLREGDSVEIGYDETSWVDEKGIGRIERKGKQITFVRPAIKGLRSE